MSELRDITIISGGQTGADRAALDFAIEHGFPHGGWCPRGRLAEDGPLDAKYLLKETPSKKYARRTKWNVRDSDATVLFTLTPELQGGTALTGKLAHQLEKPCLHLIREEGQPAQHAKRLRDFIRAHDVALLNIAGPRQSQQAEIAAFVNEVLSNCLL